MMWWNFPTEHASSMCARPQTPDDKCRFTVVSLWEDRDTVGELKKYRDMDVQIRGIVQSMHGRAGMVLEPRTAVLWRSAQVQAQSPARARIQRRREPPSRQRPQPALPGRPPRFYEHQGSGDAARQVSGASYRVFERRRKARAVPAECRTQISKRNQRRAQADAQVRVVADGADDLRREGVAEDVNAEEVDRNGRRAHRRRSPSSRSRHSAGRY